MKKYCHICGYENASKDTFCVKCGTELLDMRDEGVKKVELTPQDTSEYKTPISQSQPIRKKQPPTVSGPLNKTVLAAVAVAIILSVAAIFLAVFMKPTATLGAGNVGTNELADNSVTGSKVADGTLTDDDISNTGISKIADNAITSNQIANNTIALRDLTSDISDSITGAANITNNSITTDKILNGTIITNDLADNSITSGKIKDGEVNSSDIASGAVGSSEIAIDAVGSDEIASGAVETFELANNAVTYDKMEIKIKCGLASNVIHGDTVNHNLGKVPTSVLVTPVYDPASEGGTVVLHANVYNVTEDSFDVALWFEIEYPWPNNPIRLEKVDGDPGDPIQSVYVYWMAIYSPLPPS